jgi:hypothetical protein
MLAMLYCSANQKKNAKPPAMTDFLQIINPALAAVPKRLPRAQNAAMLHSMFAGMAQRRKRGN